MEWIVVFVLHLLCGMAGMAGVHSQENSTSGITSLYQDFEGDAVHSIMRSWVDAGTNSSWLTDTMGWSFTEHPCYDNETRKKERSLVQNLSAITWQGLFCRNKLNPSTLVRTYYLNSIFLDETFLTVTVGDFYPRRIVGGLPPAILNLTSLESLVIRDAIKPSGTLPPGIFCYLDDLRFLILENCSLNGSISIGHTPVCDTNIRLEHLDLSWNSFTSVNPGEFGSLQHLNVSNNQLKGEVLLEGYYMETIDLSNNFITNISFNLLLFSYSFKSIFAKNNSIMRFPIELFKSQTLQDIYLDFNNISSFSQDFSYTNFSTLQKISMGNNKLQLFPKGLLLLPKLEKIILDSNYITGELRLPNISCQNSKIKMISLLYNNITHFYPSNDTSSCFSESRILSDNKLFLGGNPICTNPSFKTRVSRLVCRFNASSPIEAEEPNIVEKTNKILIIIIASGGPVVFFAFILACFVIQRLKKKNFVLREFQSELDKKDVKPNLYSLTELKVATQDFHTRNELGRGGFGIVYKGVLPDGNHVAVKKLTKLSMEQGIQDFLSEIITVSNIKHRNLVQLKGCCVRENQRILVHEFVENENLADALWRKSRSDTHLDWPTRFNIILGIARGLAYLHEDIQPAIIHRDIKGKNILLDKLFHPKIADFGLALFYPSFDDGETHMNVSKVAGTMGYMAPEYLCYGQVSSKLDVFSFGILVLEIVSGRKNIDLKSPSTEQYLVQWARELHANDNLSNLKDKSLEEMTSVEDATFQRVVKVGLRCLHHLAARRPTMSEVVAMFIGNKDVDDSALEDYHEGLPSSYAMGSSSFCSSTLNSSLQCLTKDDSNMQLDFECHNQSLQLSETILLSK